MKLYGIMGTGGFAREVVPVAQQMLSQQFNTNSFQVVFITPEPIYQARINNYLVLSLTEFLQHDSHEKYFNIAIANHALRQKEAKFLLSKGIQPFSIFAHNHVAYDQNEIGEGAILCAFTTITANAKVGKFFHANIYSYIAHDCIIGDFVTFAPNVHCNGNILIEDAAYIGTGAILKQGNPDKPLRIGAGAIVGMGAVVTKDVPANTTVIGNPAKPFEKRVPAN